MLQIFKNFIRNSNLFDQSDCILLAVSGGVDSVVMVKLFHDAGFNFGIAHSNFKLRETESDKDEEFVKQLAAQMGVPFYSRYFDTKAYASEQKISIQMAARDLRYAWFNELLDEFNYKYVATAHHLDDQAETFFINLLRGTGISGMHGILPKQNKVIRPLMFTTNEKIRLYADEVKLLWREDQSNKDRKYLRNKIRIDILSELNKINPLFSYKLNESISHLRDVETIFNNHIIGVNSDLVQHTPEGIKISIDWVYEYEPHGTYLYELLKPYGFTYPIVNEIVKSLNTFSGKVFYSHTHRIVRDREFFIIQPLSEIQPDSEADSTYYIEMDLYSIQYPVCLCMNQTGKINELPFGKTTIACLDFDKLVFPLKLRKWEKGDWFIPLGLKGRKKLSDFFIDQKISVSEKEKTWLLVSGDDIVWVIGKRIDNRFRITSKTRKAYMVTCVDKSGETETASCGCSLLFS